MALGMGEAVDPRVVAAALSDKKAAEPSFLISEPKTTQYTDLITFEK